jgi:hypothetical protein
VPADAPRGARRPRHAKPAPSYPSNGGSNIDDPELGPSDAGGGEGQEEDIPF